MILPEFPRLQQDLRTEVLIIGGGMAGLLLAFLLEEEGVDYVLVERDRIASKNTGNTTAKLTIQHGLIYDRLIREFDVETAQKYLRANDLALKKYLELCQKIDCDLERKDSYVYTTRSPEKIEAEWKALNKIGYPAEYEDRISLPFPTMGALKITGQAQFHPLKFLAEIAKDLRIYEHTRVTELGGHRAVTESGTITAERIVVATHYPMNNKHGAYFLKLYQSRSDVLALEQAEDVDGMYVDESEKGLSFRNYGDLLLLGGGGHRTGKKGGKWQELEEFAREYYPDSVERYRWAAQDCMSLDKVPYIGLYGKHTEGFYVTSGFNKWGMTGSMTAAMVLRDQIIGKENEFAEVFRPQRQILRPQLFCNILESTCNLCSFSRKRCPHMGCALRWNKEEHSWDCPCHGSRFAEDGTLLDNPANADRNEKKERCKN